jgi:HK97 family phage major capsid protein
VATVDAQVRDRLKSVRDDLKDARARRAEAKREREAAKKAFSEADHGDKKVTEWPEFQAAEQAVAALGDVDDEIHSLQTAERGILQMLGEHEESQAMLGVNRDGEQVHQGGLRQRVAWDAHSLLRQAGPDGEPTAYQQAVDAGIFSSTARFGSLQLGEIASREEAVQFMSELPAAPSGTVLSTGVSGLIPADRRGLVPPVLRPLRFLDLIPTGTTDSNMIQYVQVTAIPASAAPVAEEAIKPAQGLTTVDATSPVRTIAGYIKVARQSMDDASGLASMINQLLPYDVRRQIEQQVIAGNGSGQNLTGLLNTSGIAAAPSALAAGDNVADALLRAMTLIILADGEPNFAAIHPLTWQDLLMMRETGGTGSARSGQYLYGGPGTAPQYPGGVASQTVWGLGLIPSTKVTQQNPVVGDSQACQLLVREGVNVKASDSDQDDFIRNRVTILAEARVAFLVWRPMWIAIARTS